MSSYDGIDLAGPLPSRLAYRAVFLQGTGTRAGEHCDLQDILEEGVPVPDSHRAGEDEDHRQLECLLAGGSPE